MWPSAALRSCGERAPIAFYPANTNATGHKRLVAFVEENHKLGGVSSISGTLASASGAFPTFAIPFYLLQL